MQKKKRRKRRRRRRRIGQKALAGAEAGLENPQEQRETLKLG